MKGDTMRHDYATTQRADALALGFIYNDKVYMQIVHSCNFAMSFARYDKTSKSHGRVACLRFRPTAWQKKFMVEQWSAKEICSLAELDAERRTDENRGHAFEKLARREIGAMQCIEREWWNGGDFMTLTTIYQAKFEGGTFCTAKQCREHRV